MTMEKDPEATESRYLHDYFDFAGRSVLELGCGDGRLTWRYANRAARVFGIDLDRDALRVASIERSADLAEKTSFIQADSTELPFASQQIDMGLFAWSF